MTSDEPTIDLATQKVLAGIEDPNLAARYANGTHFICATHGRQAEMATRALFARDPVVLVYPGGQEVLLTPETARGTAGLLLRIVTHLLRPRSRKRSALAVHLPPYTRVDLRDAAGQSISA